ncbi:MAG: hypothetical protein HQM12_05610 [SAR324 cluster bacterium]|nr:hypothetical protein [SAR324 cluster bacterium]
MEVSFSLDDIKRKIKIEQAVRTVLGVFDDEELTLDEGLVAWNMLGFTIFQEIYPEASHEEIHKNMIEFANTLFYSKQKIS